MSNKRGPGRFVAAHQTEAARRALIQPVPCWEYKWVIPPGMPSGSTLRLRQWVKTNKKQEFSDDEDESQVPLAPLPDEPDQDQVDDDEEEDEKEEKEESAPPATGQATPMPAETSMRGVPGLDTPVSGTITPLSDTVNVLNIAAARAAAATTAKAPHPLATSFGPEDMETDDNGADSGNIPDNDLLPADGALMDPMSLDLGLGMDEAADNYMDMMNNGSLDLDDDLLGGGIGDP